MKNKLTSRDGLFGIISRYPRLTLGAALFFSLLSFVYTWQRMEFLTGRDDLMPKNTGFHRDYREWREEFGDMEEIVVVIESTDKLQSVHFGERLYERLSKDSTHFSSIFYPGSLEFFRKNGLLFTPLVELQVLSKNLTMASPLLKELSVTPSVQTLFTSLTGQIDGYLGNGDHSPRSDTLLDAIIFMLGKLGNGFSTFGENSGVPLSLEELFFQSSDDKKLVSNKADHMQILTLLPVRNGASFVPAEEAIRVARREIVELRKLPEFAGVTAGLTGTPVLEYEEMATSQRDIAIATVISLTLTVFLLLIAFRGALNVVAAMVTLIIAICLAFGFATFAVGHLNILSMVFAIMLIGVGIEYSIQVVLRYQEELANGAGHLAAIETGIKRNAWGIAMAAATLMAAFLTFVFTDFKGIAELGIIAAGGVVICVLTTFTVLPAMLLLLAKYRKSGDKNGRGNCKIKTLILVNSFCAPFVVAIKQLFFGHPKKVVAGATLLCLVSFYPLIYVRFDYNLLNLQAVGLESVRYAYKLMRSSKNSGYFAVITAESASDAAVKSRALEAFSTVDHVVSLNSFVPDDQQQKLDLLSGLRNTLADVKPGKYDDNLQMMALPAVFENFHDSVERLKIHLVEAEKSEAKQVSVFLVTLNAFFAKLEGEKDGNAVGMLREFQGGMLAELPDKIASLKSSLNAVPVTMSDIPGELRGRFVGKTGKYLLQVAPKGEIFDRAPLKAFLDDVRSVDPTATGEPVMVYESMTIMRDAYGKAFVYAFIAIGLILIVTFRSFMYAAIGLVPLLVGVLFMVSGMWLCGISFNSANIIVMPLVLGIAVDSGIYLINRFRREEGDAIAVVTSSTGEGILLNTLTIMASFGALMVAHHQGIFSIGVVMSLGMVACQIAFILVLPAVLTLVGKR